jgi:FHS family Na+ dependent glucose MFS transporter 1
LTAQTDTTSHVRPILNTLAYYSAFITLGLTAAVTGPALPWLAEQTQSRIDQISLIFVVGSLGYMIGSLLSGRGYDRFPGHRIQAAMLLLMAVAVAIVPVIPSVWPLLAVCFFLGIGQGGVDVGCNTLLMWTHGRRVGLLMNGLHFFFGIGSLVAPIVFALVIGATGSISWIYWSFALLMLPIAAWLWTLPSPSIRIESPNNRSERTPLPLVGLFVACFVFYVGAEASYGNWIFTYTTTLNLATETEAAYLTSVFWGFFTIGRLLGIGISARRRSRTILYMDLVGCLLSMGVILLWPSSFIALWIGTLGLGLSMASIFPTTLVFARERMHLSGKVTSWFLVGSGIGSMFWPWLIGQLFEPVGPRVTMTIIFITILINLSALVALTLRPKKGGYLER